MRSTTRHPHRRGLLAVAAGLALAAVLSSCGRGPEEPAGMVIRCVELEEGSQEAVDEFLAGLEPLRWDAGG